MFIMSVSVKDKVSILFPVFFAYKLKLKQQDCRTLLSHSLEMRQFDETQREAFMAKQNKNILSCP